jgi:hypothetical protein
MPKTPISDQVYGDDTMRAARAIAAAPGIQQRLFREKVSSSTIKTFHRDRRATRAHNHNRL